MKWTASALAELVRPSSTKSSIARSSATVVRNDRHIAKLFALTTLLLVASPSLTSIIRRARHNRPWNFAASRPHGGSQRANQLRPLAADVEQRKCRWNRVFAARQGTAGQGRAAEALCTTQARRGLGLFIHRSNTLKGYLRASFLSR